MKVITLSNNELKKIIKDSIEENINPDGILYSLYEHNYVPISGEIGSANEEQITCITNKVIEKIKILDEFYKEKDWLGFPKHGKGIIQEGLICTYPAESLKRIFANLGFSDKGIYVFDMYQDIKANPKSVMRIVFNHGVSKDDLEVIRKILNTYGWFISRYHCDGDFPTLNDELLMKMKNNNCSVTIEAKYDLLIDPATYPPYFYHITKLKYVNKILNQGLTPRSTSKVTTAPERVYLLKDYPNDWKNSIAPFFREKEKNNEKYALLRIDGKYINSDCNLYHDPNSNFRTAYYTLEPINPKAIEIFETE